ncbi:hypothetical protein HDU99_004805 [Rhizoclosmatium hyalinum]|nr:hypothetical protein HDU99_004805 [Rhizoclosmatium hyalinum]
MSSSDRDEIEPTEVQPRTEYKCIICDRTFKNNNGYSQHIGGQAHKKRKHVLDIVAPRGEMDVYMKKKLHGEATTEEISGSLNVRDSTEVGNVLGETETNNWNPDPIPEEDINHGCPDEPIRASAAHLSPVQQTLYVQPTIPLISHSSMDPSKFSALFKNIEMSDKKLSPFYPYPNETYQSFMRLVESCPKVPDSVWDQVLKWIIARPKPLDPKDLPKKLKEGIALLQSSSVNNKKVGEFETHIIGHLNDETPVVVRHRDIVDCLLELLLDNFHDMYFEPAIQVDKNGDRIYGEFNTGSWWISQTSSIMQKLGPLAKLLALEVYSDSTQLDGGGKVSEHPVYMSCSNIPLKLRHRPATKKLLGFIETPWSKLSKKERETDKFRDFVRDMYHKSFEYIFQKIKELQTFGFYFYLGCTMYHFVPRMSCFPADMQEHYVITRTSSATAKCPCLECMVQIHFLHMTEFGDPEKSADDYDSLSITYAEMLMEDNTPKLRTEHDMEAIAATKNSAKIKKASIHPGLNAFTGFILSPLYLSVPSDYFMHGISGINKHIFDNLILFLNKYYTGRGEASRIEKAMALRFRAMPRTDQSRLPTNSVMDSTNLSAKERNAITLVLLYAVQGLLKEPHFTLFLKMMIAHLKWQKICKVAEMSEAELVKVEELTKEFCLAFVAMYESIGKELQIPKLHALVHHFGSSVRRFGIPLNWVTAMYEHFHHFIKNDYKYKSNKRDVVGGLIANNARSTAFSYLDTKFDEEKEVVLIESESESDRFIGQQLAFSVIQTCHANTKIESLKLSILGEKSCARAIDDLKSRETMAPLERATLGPTMQSTLEHTNLILDSIAVRINQTDGVFLDDSDSEPEFQLGDDDIEFKYLKFHNSVIPAKTRYRYHANTSFFGYCRFSNIQLRGGEAGPIFAKVLALVSISSRAKHHGGGSAWVQFYEDAVVRQPLKYGCPYLKLTKVKSLIGVEEFGKEVMLVPDFSRIENGNTEVFYFQNAYM